MPFVPVTAIKLFGFLLNILEANLASQEQSIIQAENNYILSKISLAQLLQISDYENFNVVIEDLDIPFSTILDNSPKSIFEAILFIRCNYSLYHESNLVLYSKIKSYNFLNV